MELEEEQLARETFSALPARIAISLWKGGLHSVDRLSRASDDDLMDLAGVDTGGLRSIRAIYPAGTGTEA